MDELDKLKNHWKQNEPSFPQVSEKEIYGMLHKKSSSIVKWILVISILEFLLQVSLTVLLKDNTTTQSFNTPSIDYLTLPMTLIGYGIILYFVYVFYIRYKKITVTDNVKNLMQSILKTRKAVSTYIYVNLAYVVVSAIIIVFVMFKTDSRVLEAVHKSQEHGNALAFYLTAFLFIFVLVGIFILLVWLFYRLIYGFLLRRLHKNYEELKKLDF